MRSNSTNAPSRSRERLARLFLIAATLAMCAVLVEIGLRVAGLSFPNFGLPDTSRGWALRPGVAGIVRGENPDAVAIRINQAGFRDRDHSTSKPPNTLRIAVLGDSYAEAMQVPLEATFWANLERELHNCGARRGSRVEVLNFGVSGYGTAQEYLTLHHKAWAYSPDIVLLTVTTGNDIRNNLRALAHEPVAPYFVYRNGELTLDDSFQNLIRLSGIRELEARLAAHSRVVQLVRAGYNGLKQIRQARQHRADRTQLEAGLDDMVYVPPQTQPWREAWQVTEGIVTMMAAEVRRHGAKFIIATLTNGIQVHPDSRVRQAFMKRMGIETLSYPDFRIRDFARRENIGTITTVDALATYAEAHQVFLHGFGRGLGEGHWNETGHRLAGELFASEVCSYLNGHRGSPE